MASRRLTDLKEPFRGRVSQLVRRAADEDLDNQEADITGLAAGGAIFQLLYTKGADVTTWDVSPVSVFLTLAT